MKFIIAIFITLTAYFLFVPALNTYVTDNYLRGFCVGSISQFVYWMTLELQEMTYKNKKS